MKSKLFIASLMLFSFSFNMIAQESKGELVQSEKYEFRPHWYVQANGGVGYTIGETRFMDLLSPAASFNVGYQFTPIFSLRAGGSGWEGRGGFPRALFNSYNFNYIQGNVDALFNLSNLFGSYRHDRTWNWYAFAGLGVNYAFNNSGAVSMSKRYVMQYLWYDRLLSPITRAGAGLDLRITDYISLNIEVNANALTDRFNSKKAGNLDWQFNALAGLRINLGKPYTKTEAIYATAVVEEEKPEATVVKETPKPVVKADNVVKFEPMTQNIFFDINKSVIRDDQSEKIDALVQFMNKYPKTRITIISYADKHTGNATINSRLSVERSDAVAEALKARGISADRISTSSKGDTEQPFQVNEENRVSVCTVK